MEWYYATMRTHLLDLTSVSDFTVAIEPVIILTTDTVVERDEPTFGRHKGGHACVCKYQYAVFYKTCVVYH